MSFVSQNSGAKKVAPFKPSGAIPEPPASGTPGRVNARHAGCGVTTARFEPIQEGGGGEKNATIVSHPNPRGFDNLNKPLLDHDRVGITLEETVKMRQGRLPSWAIQISFWKPATTLPSHDSATERNMCPRSLFRVWLHTSKSESHDMMDLEGGEQKGWNQEREIASSFSNRAISHPCVVLIK